MVAKFSILVPFYKKNFFTLFELILLKEICSFKFPKNYKNQLLLGWLLDTVSTFVKFFSPFVFFWLAMGRQFCDAH